MGSGGWTLALAPIKGAKQATNAAVRKALISLLGELWDQELPYPWDDRAWDWISLGEDSLLSIQDRDGLKDKATELTFWFYGSGDWPSELADHWLRATLAWRRPDVEHAVAKLGFRIAADAWPAAGETFRYKFVTHEERVGRVDGETVTWQLTADGKYSTGESKLADLPQELRDKLANRCACPFCDRHELAADPKPRDKTHVERLLVADRFERVVAPRKGGMLAVTGGWRWHAWGGRSDGGGPWHTIDVLTDKKREVYLLHEVGDTLVALLGYGSPKPARVSTISKDGGVTWSKPGKTRLPEGKMGKTLTNPHDKSLVFVVSGNAKQMWRSDDGGRTFGKVISPTMNKKPANQIRELLPCGGRLLAQWRPDKKSPICLAASDDGGKTFTKIPLPDTQGVGVWGTASGDVVVLSRDWPGKCRRTSDGGRTWIEASWPDFGGDVYLGGRWFVLDGTTGLAISDDDGKSWRTVLDGKLSAVFPDDADPSSCYVTTQNALYHVTIA